MSDYPRHYPPDVGGHLSGRDYPPMDRGRRGNSEDYFNTGPPLYNGSRGGDWPPPSRREGYSNFERHTGMPLGGAPFRQMSPPSGVGRQGRGFSPVAGPSLGGGFIKRQRSPSPPRFDAYAGSRLSRSPQRDAVRSRSPLFSADMMARRVIEAEPFPPSRMPPVGADRLRSRSPDRFRQLSPIRPSMNESRYRDGAIIDRRPVSPIRSQRPLTPEEYRSARSPPRRTLPPSHSPPRGRWGSRDEPVQQRETTQSSSSDDSLPVGPDGLCSAQATVKEYVNSFSGILELCLGPDDFRIPPTIFFHASVTWMPNKSGNPYGPPVKFLDLLGPNVSPSEKSVSLERDLPIGTKVNLKCVKVKSSDYVNYLAFQVWPTTTGSPPDTELQNQRIFIEKKQEHHLKEFHNALDEAKESKQVVQATFPIFPWGGSGPDSAATVWQIKDDNYGVIEVKGYLPEPFRFFALFHRDHVWLQDGKRGVDVEYFKNKPLNEMVTVGQLVTISARSIVTTSGTKLQPSILELQAVIVSLNVGSIPPGAPKPTVCMGGTGAFGMSPRTSWYYFQQDLANTLNMRLVTYLRTYDKQYPALEPAFLTFSEPKRRAMDSSSAAGSSRIPPPVALQPIVTNAVGQVKEHPSPDYFVLENFDHTFRVIVPASRTYVSRAHSNKSMEELFPLASTVHFNASLVDETKPVQYLSTLAWSYRDATMCKEEIDARDRPSDEEIRCLYRLHNDRLTSKPRSGPPTVYYEAKEGIVVKILDENFAIIEVDKNFVLFDTCDVWLDPLNTLDKVGKQLGDVIKLGSVMRFHAALIDPNYPIQYLASSVWLNKDDNIFHGQRPTPIKRESIHQQKIDIFKMVVQSVGPLILQLQAETASKAAAAASKSMAASAAASAAASVSEKIKSSLKPSDQLQRSVNGTIKIVFYDKKMKENQNILGGLIQTNNQRSFAFFLTKHSLIYSTVPAIGQKVKINAKTIQASRWSPDHNINLIAVSMFNHGDVMEKERESEKKFEESNNVLINLLELSNVVEAIIKLNRNGSGGLVDVTSASSSFSAPPLSGAGTLKIHDEVPYSTLKCMINEKSGILESNFDRKSLCYFELDDVNIEPPYVLRDLAKLMSNMDKVRVRYQAKMINDKGAVQYVAHTNGVQIIGPLPTSMAHIKLREQDKSEQPVSLRSEKLIRYRKAEELFTSGKFWSVESILDDSYKKKPDLVCARGVVKLVLNENFALIQGPISADPDDQSYCLFDTFDLYLERNVTAADSGKNVEHVTPVETEVFYNACFINSDNDVSFLATSVWAVSNTHIKPPLPPLTRDAIQEDKVNIFNQVASSCAPFISELKFKASNQASSVHDIDAKSRRQDVERVYSSDHYKSYVRELPKHKRSSRDPRTPDRNAAISPSDWSDRVSMWKNEIFRWNKKRKESTPGVRDRIVKNDLFDHQISGQLLKEVDINFVILELSNGGKALVHRSRVWIQDKPLFGDWRPLRNNFFKKLNVNARKWTGPHGIDYQVTFCHTGGGIKLDFQTKQYMYSPTMKAWITPLLNVDQLDAEAAEYEAMASRRNI